MQMVRVQQGEQRAVQVLNPDCKQLSQHLERHVFAGHGPYAKALADATTYCIWNMVCAAVKQIAETPPPRAPEIQP